MILSRRHLLQLATAFAAAAGSRAARPGPEGVQAATPPGLPAIILARALEDSRVRSLNPAIDLRNWRDPGQLRAWLVRGDVALTAAPTNVAANLHNRGLPVVLLNVCVWGILGVLARQGPLARITDLAGRHVGVPFRGDMPDLVLRYLAGRAGMDFERDLRVTYMSTPFEAVQLFLARRIDAVVLPEPARSAARQQGRTLGIDTHELDLQTEWARLTGGPAELPQAGIACRESLAAAQPELLAALQEATTNAVAWIQAEPAAAAALGESVFNLPAAVLQEGLGHVRLASRSATAARPALEDFFSALAELSPDFIGGRLPGPDFYLSLS